jgi:hypothetical protein
MKLQPCAAVLVAASCLTVCADERHLDFVQGLRDRGYHDLAVEYLEQLAKRENLPDSVRAVIDYELGKVMLLQATEERDLVKRDEQLEKSREHLQRFVSEHAGHARAADAMTDLALILVERGRVAVLQSNSPTKRAQRKELQEQARGYFGDARKQFDEAEKKFQAEYKKFPSFIDPTNPRNKQQIEDRREAQLNVMQAQLNLAVIEYEAAQTFDRESKEFKDTLNLAVKKFEDVYTRYRGWLAGLYARMWMGKCFEEMGDPRKAVGFYEELEKHEDPALKGLQRQVIYFHIICMNKRGDYVLAQDTAQRWINENPREARTKQGLGVRMELASSLRDQAKKLPENDNNRSRMLAQAMTIWNEVARFEGEFKELALQEKAKWGALVGRRDRTMTFDEALTVAERAREEDKWAEAAEAYEIALSQVTDKQDINQINKTRYLYGFCLYQLKKYLQAGVVCQHIALRHPDSGLALHSTYISLASFVRSYETAKEGEQPEVDRAQLERMAAHLESRWPDTNEADFARIALGAIALKRDELAAAAQAYERVSPKSEDYLMARQRAAESYWNAYLSGVAASDAATKATELQGHLQKAREIFSKSRDERLAKLDPAQPIPEDAVRADLFLAQVYLEGGQDKESLALLEPLVKAVEERKDLDSLQLPALTAAMQAYVRLENLDQAEVIMNKIEATGKDTAEITALFQLLAEQLKQKMDRLVNLGDKAGAEQTRRSFLAFLDRLSRREAGQTFDSLSWVAASFFGLAAYDQAERLYRDILTKFGDEPAIKADPKKQRALMSTRLQLVVALRQQKKYAEARQLIEPLYKTNSKALDVIMEYGRVLSWCATETPADYENAIKHWKQYSGYMGFMKPKPAQYYPCWLYLALSRIGKASASPGTQAQEYTLAGREINFVLSTMADTDRNRPLDDSFDDLVPYAAALGVAEKPKTLGEFFDVMLRKVGGAAPAATPRVSAATQ